MMARNRHAVLDPVPNNDRTFLTNEALMNGGLMKVQRDGTLTSHTQARGQEF
jgi:hypothetical protein